MISACSARVLSLNSVIRLQLMMSCAISDKDCHSWASIIREDSTFEAILPKIESIISCFDEKANFAVNLVKRNTIISSILAFTSGMEFFLQDIVILCLRRNSSLRKKAFSNHQISASDLEEYDTIEEIKRLHIDLISSSNTSGSLFIPKFKRMSRFLNMNDFPKDTELLESLDSIWKLRNRLAHNNHNSISDFNFLYKGTNYQLSGEFTSGEYNIFIMNLCSLFEKAIDHLVDFDSAALKVWDANDFLDYNSVQKVQ